MFEDSILDSGGKGKKATTVLVSTVVHVALLGVLIIIPLIFVEQLEAAKYLVALTAPPPPPPPPPPPAAAVQAKPVQVKQVQVDPGAIVAPTEIPKQIARIVEEAAPTGGVVGGVVGGTGGGVPGGVLGGILTDANKQVGAPPPPPPPPPPPAALPPQRIGGDVAQANLISAPKPQYPQLARSARVQGVVLLQATISKEGTIQDLRVISGHPLLNEAALEAVRQWRYKPQMLNNQPIEVITTITVNFTFAQ
jgi:protein TonB